MTRLTAPWRRATVAAALGALTFGVTLPAAATPPDHAVEAREAGQAKGEAARAAAQADDSTGDDGTVTSPQGISWK